jgi:DNA-binding transcriptional LysR family regulator
LACAFAAGGAQLGLRGRQHLLHQVGVRRRLGASEHVGVIPPQPPLLEPELASDSPGAAASFFALQYMR